VISIIWNWAARRGEVALADNPAVHGLIKNCL
jgi:hypothetical protein